MRFIGEAVRKSRCSGSIKKKVSGAGRIGEPLLCYRARGGVTGQVENRTVFPLFALRPRCKPSETEPEVVLKELAGSNLVIEPKLSACSNKNVRQKAVEAVASASILINKLKNVLLDTFSMRK